MQSQISQRPLLPSSNVPRIRCHPQLRRKMTRPLPQGEQLASSSLPGHRSDEGRGAEQSWRHKAGTGTEGARNSVWCIGVLLTGYLLLHFSRLALVRAQHFRLWSCISLLLSSLDSWYVFTWWHLSNCWRKSLESISIRTQVSLVSERIFVTYLSFSSEYATTCWHKAIKCYGVLQRDNCSRLRSPLDPPF